VTEKWRVRESKRVPPEKKDVWASWSVRSTTTEGREVWTRVDVTRDAMKRLESGEVADATRQALRTQGRSPVEATVKRGEDPPARIVCTPTGCKARTTP
jgi:hypothetical protein